MKKAIKNIRMALSGVKKRYCIARQSRSRIKEYSKYYLGSKDAPETVSYRIMIDGHAIEKGLTSSSPRYFGIEKVQSIIGNLEKYEKNKWKKDYAYEFGVGILYAYVEFYESNNWKDRMEYKNTKAFVSSRKRSINPGIMEINNSAKELKFDYNAFLDSRHSIRSFLPKKIKVNDIKSAVNMAIKTPTACNRQMVKVYYVNSDDIKNKVMKYSKGMTLFDRDNSNLLVVTYDRSAFRGDGEIMQGMFNAGLFSMNLVNAMHSIGIGSCMLEYGIAAKEENENKRILGIPDNEKVAIVIAAGYYPGVYKVPKSLRKPIEEILRIVD